MACRQGTGKVTESYILIHKQKREKEERGEGKRMDLAWASKTLEPTSSNTPPPTRSHPLILLKLSDSSTSWRPCLQTHEPVGVILTVNRHLMTIELFTLIPRAVYLRLCASTFVAEIVKPAIFL